MQVILRIGCLGVPWTKKKVWEPLLNSLIQLPELLYGGSFSQPISLSGSGCGSALPSGAGIETL